jgi:hypothetical protein
VTAIAAKRKRTTLVGFFATLVLVLAAASMFVIGVVTLSNSEEGEAVGVDVRPKVALPATPNAMLAVTDAEGALTSVVVMTLLPTAVGGSIVVVPANADATASFGAQRRPLTEVFAADGADVAVFATSVEEMLSITIERSQAVTIDELAAIVEGLVGDAVVIGPGQPIDEALWADVAGAAPVDGDTTAVPVDEFDQPIPPVDVGELAERLMAGEVQSRALVSRTPTEAENPTAANVVIVDRRDANLVFAQVSPALVSTPNTGLSVRIVGAFDDEQIAASNGRYESTSELMLDVIGEMYFFQANVVSIDTQPVSNGAAAVTVIEVAQPQFIEAMESIAPIVFGESDVVLASTVIEGVDVVVTLGTDYIAKHAAAPPLIDMPVDETLDPTTAGTTDTSVAGTTGDTVVDDD